MIDLSGYIDRSSSEYNIRTDFGDICINQYQTRECYPYVFTEMNVEQVSGKSLVFLCRLQDVAFVFKFRRKRMF